jgi:alkylation response protein AidB-like acyl-CoA dehydrogenase
MEPFTIEEYRQTYLSDNRLNELYQVKLFKIFVPKVYQGLELSLGDGMIELMRIAEVQGGLGWTLNLGAGANWFSGFFNNEAAVEIFSPDQAVIAGSGFTSGNFSKVENGFLIDGSWSRCTGAKHATFFSLNAKSEKGEVKTFVLPRHQVELADEKWQIFGLRNTSSYAINIQKETIPDRYRFTINTIQNPHAYLVHKVPFETFARLCMSASFVGIVKCFYNKCINHPVNQASLKFCEENLLPIIEQASGECLVWSEKITQSIKKDQFKTKEALKMQKALGGNNVKLYDKVQQLALKAGLPIVEEDTLVHWAYRDVLTAVQHYMVKP